MRALIVEQRRSRGALAAVRALSAAGWFVGVASPQLGGLAAASRSCGRHHLIRSLNTSMDAFVDSVVAAVRAGGYDVVFGAGEAEVLALSAARDAVPAIFPHAAHDVVLRALDKAELARAATAVGIAVPEANEPEALADETTPIIVKARGRRRRPPCPAGTPWRPAAGSGRHGRVRVGRHAQRRGADRPGSGRLAVGLGRPVRPGRQLIRGGTGAARGRVRLADRHRPAFRSA